MNYRVGIDIGGTFTDLALHKGDANVTKWAADLKNRLKATATTAAVKDKEKP